MLQGTAFQRWPGESHPARGPGQAAWPQRSASPCAHRPGLRPEQPPRSGTSEKPNPAPLLRRFRGGAADAVPWVIARTAGLCWGGWRLNGMTARGPPQSSEVAPTVSGPAPLCASASHEQSSKELRVGTMLFIPGVSGRQIASVGEGAVGRIFLLASPEVRGGSVPRPRARTAGLKTRRSAGEHFTGTGRVSS